MRLWTFWLLFSALALIDALALGGWTALGWSLRGATHDGTPMADIVWTERMIVSLLGSAALAHLSVAIWGVVRGRSEAWGASLAAAVAVPVALPVGMVLVGGALRLWFG